MQYRHEPWRPSWARTLRNLARACRWTADAIDASHVRELYRQQTMRYVDRLVNGWRAMKPKYAAFHINDHNDDWWATLQMWVVDHSAHEHSLVVNVGGMNDATCIANKHSSWCYPNSVHGSTVAYAIAGDDTLRAVLCDMLTDVLAGASLGRMCAHHLRLILIDEAMREKRSVSIVYRGRSIQVVPHAWSSTYPYTAPVGSLSFTALDQHDVNQNYEMRKLYYVAEDT